MTGAGRGIGRASAVELARRGHDLVLAARSTDQLAEVAVAVEEIGGEALVVETDVTSDDECMALMDAAADRFSRLDVLVCNAGGGVADLSLMDTTPEDWRSVIDLNVHSVYYSVRHAVPYMREVGGGKIMVVGSGTGHVPISGVAAYAVAKAGAAHIVRVLAQELAADGIDINEVVPGPVLTDLTRANFTVGEPPPLSAVERVKEPKEVAALVGWLAGMPSRGPTGQVFSLARRQL
ncbi:SDR family NAD(P)-dependent oxidoreductase [Dietzia lutea]|uniref:SDR family NAD(P)-dependent oxidoreductase n=1 Tax=Dietzia lutea TaxID=546160 RepID=UPI00132FBEA7|nr:SDR family oxidoreductase [Dietzia lutea]